MKEFIKNRPALNLSELARQIDMDKASFQKWVVSKRSLPKHKQEKLKEVLVKYGFECVEDKND